MEWNRVYRRSRFQTKVWRINRAEMWSERGFSNLLKALEVLHDVLLELLVLSLYLVCVLEVVFLGFRVKAMIWWCLNFGTLIPAIWNSAQLVYFLTVICMAWPTLLTVDWRQHKLLCACLTFILICFLLSFGLRNCLIVAGRNLVVRMAWHLRNIGAYLS